MILRLISVGLSCLLLSSGCGAAGNDDARNATESRQRIVSLDFCADQYVLKFADRENILALSPDAEASFSYMRKQAHDLPKVRPRAEDVLLLHPDIVVRSYGGGPNATAFFNRAGVKVVQIGYANNIADVKKIVLDAADGLGFPERGVKLVKEMDARLAALQKTEKDKTILYMTSKGAVAGRQTQIDELLTLAGYKNFQSKPGWGALSLERFAYDSPDVIATGFFETSDLVSDIWTPARHRLVRRKLQELPVIRLPGAWTACGGWFILDAAEALAYGASKHE